MKVLRTHLQFRKARESLQRSKTLGFVPTMGALHEGHLSLVRKAKKECDRVAVSIFVNPTQFGEGEDLEAYPRMEKKDLDLLKKLKVDLVFMPKRVQEVYPNTESMVQVTPPTNLTKMMEGFHRPGHFVGVCTVVLKLFQIVQPDRAYFGEKDFQQLRVIEEMVRDLFLPIKIRRCPTLREKTGLAMSSRNEYFNDGERKAAAEIYRALKECQTTSEAHSRLRSAGFRVEYLESWDKNLTKRVNSTEMSRWLVAARYGEVRLIDNLVKPALRA